ncbi:MULTISPECIES: ABC transporter substrate-binding protein [Prauserella]|uniref:ABC transporter substrate-binding protein n=1 Tax=Prauserella endophytica TaxID=1592324 RepID=A0ABY2RWL4_9PSEU|nr:MULTISPECIES: ABC transporter substrate-binding protein [Prauserella]TKG63560.1 ABC transporter substrate-binding protein [Prauserella endophytica]
MAKRSPRLKTLMAAALSLALVSTSCGTNSGAVGSNNSAGLPTTLVVATGDYKVPTSFLNKKGELDGLNVDLTRALGRRLGVEMKLVAVPFDAVIPGIQSGRFDTALFNVSDTPERRAVVDLVDYAPSGTVIVTRKNDRKGITANPLTLCGRTVAVKAGQTEFNILNKDVSPKCKETGEPAINFQTFKDDNGLEFAVETGRADAFLGGTTVTPYFVSRNSDTFEIVGKLPIALDPLGMPFAKGRDDLVGAVLAAWKEIWQSGEYERIAKKWSLQSIVPKDISLFTVNGGDKS